MILVCPSCGGMNEVRFRPEEAPAAAADEPMLRCPVPKCDGWVCHVTWKMTEEESSPRPFWGCGECGSYWLDVENLHKEVVAVVERFPYRAACYERVAGRWVSVLERQPENYEALVLAEPHDASSSFERG